MSGDDAIKNHGAERRLFLRRTIAAGVLLLVLIGLLLARIYYLQVAKHGYYETRSQDNRMRVEVVSPVRGLIYSRHGQLLANNQPAYQLEIVPEQVTDSVEATLDRLNAIVTITAADRSRFQARMRQTPSFRGTPIKLSLTQREVARFEVNREQFPGVDIRAGLTRHYPMGKYAAHVVGYVGGITERDLSDIDRKRYRGASHIGKSGVELSYESALHGNPGSRVIETNASGRALRQLDESPAEAGQSLVLTLDARLQRAAYDALGDKDGAIVALDPEDGGVLALVSKPGYDSDLFVDGISHKNYARLINNPHKPLYNRALQGQYPPGSTIKPVMALGALESGLIDPDKRVWCPGYITLPGSEHHYRDWKRSGHGWINLTQAIERSSDVYFYKLGMKLGIDDIHRYGALFGLGHKTGIDLPRENPGIMPSREWKHGHRSQPWYPGETLITVIGQGYMTATPLQLAVVASQIAERGHAYKPHVLKARRDTQTGATTPVAPEALSPIQLTDQRHWETVINAMKGVINDPRGTAHHYVGMNLKYPIAGKSGSAQVAGLPQNEVAPDLASIPYKLREHALFIAFAPIEDPKIAVAVLVEHGGGGSSVAGPIARDVIDSYLDSLQGEPRGPITAKTRDAPPRVAEDS
ncbi:penicillin-binding protein 2 [Salinisphaera japonica]|uniref:Peptidoglycan D,D-transpeptidase MrdA n=1 Tax=Salinisphaera japonica YTM-1 TaxID=1209778 RepID=A0A423PPA7_9GAMM|nr:penicillin-binding protein 2 [Salinisphaera japonica]ROO27435.1 peptidoglycan glycosyltransferase [Salinisphaera japonica YTM-1]